MIKQKIVNKRLLSVKTLSPSCQDGYINIRGNGTATISVSTVATEKIHGEPFRVKLTLIEVITKFPCVVIFPEIRGSQTAEIPKGVITFRLRKPV